MSEEFVASKAATPAPTASEHSSGGGEHRSYGGGRSGGGYQGNRGEGQGGGGYRPRRDFGNRGGSGGYARNDDGGDMDDGMRKGRQMKKYRKKVCRFCANKDLIIDYKNVEMLERFITDRGKILPRRITGTCSKHQRELARTIKQSRSVALLPYTVK